MTKPRLGPRVGSVFSPVPVLKLGAILRPVPVPVLRLVLVLVLVLGLSALACTPSSDGGSSEGISAAVLARNAEIEGRFDWARIEWARAIEQAPTETARQHARVREANAWLSGYQRSLSNAVERFEIVLEHDPDDVASRARLVSSLLTLGDAASARAHAERLGDDARAERLRAEAWMGADLETARRAVERAIEREPFTAANHALAARLADRAGDLRAVLDAARRAVELDPLDARSWYLLGRSQRAFGTRLYAGRDSGRDGAETRDAEAARRSFQIHEAITRLLGEGTLAAPGPREALAQIAALRELGVDPVDSADGAERATSLDRLEARLRLEAGEPIDDEIERLAATVAPAEQGELARLAAGAGRLGLARRLYETLLAETADPTSSARGQSGSDPGALSSLVILDLDAGDLESAAARLGPALAADPEVGRYHLLAGRLAVAQDRPDEAAEHFRSALARAPWNGSWRIELAELHRVRGDLEAFRSTLAAAPSGAAPSGAAETAADAEIVTPTRDDALADYRRRHRALLGPSSSRGDAG